MYVKGKFVLQQIQKIIQEKFLNNIQNQGFPIVYHLAVPKFYDLLSIFCLLRITIMQLCALFFQ